MNHWDDPSPAFIQAWHKCAMIQVKMGVEGDVFLCDLGACVHVYVYTCVYGYPCVHMGMWRSEVNLRCQSTSGVHPACLVRISHWDLVELTKLGRQDYDSQGPTCLHSPSAEITKCMPPF